MQRSLILLLSPALAALYLMSCDRAREAVQPSVNEQYLVYAAVVEVLRAETQQQLEQIFKGIEVEPFDRLIVRGVSHLPEGVIPWLADSADVAAADETQRLKHGLLELNRSPILLEKHSELPSYVVVVPHQELDAVRAEGWGFMAQRYGSRAIVRLSRVAFDNALNRALVYADYSICPAMCSAGLLLWLSRVGDGWTVVSEEWLWVT